MRSMYPTSRLLSTSPYDTENTNGAFVVLATSWIHVRNGSCPCTVPPVLQNLRSYQPLPVRHMHDQVLMLAPVLMMYCKRSEYARAGKAAPQRRVRPPRHPHPCPGQCTAHSDAICSDAYLSNLKNFLLVREGAAKSLPELGQVVLVEKLPILRQRWDP